MKAPKIKFCGITREQDAELAVSLDAWAVGMIMWPHSPRAVPLDRAAGLAALLKRRAEIVGVFVNQTLDEVTGIADAAGLTMLQFHGDEGPVFCSEAARRTGCKVIRAARVHSAADIQALAAYHTDFHLLDSYRPGVPGGTGETFAWDLAASHRRIAPPKGKGQRVPLILSGGLTPANVAGAIAAVKPFAVDVASGVESAPGYKDGEKMRAFAAAVAATAAEADAPDEVGHAA
ncbi:MAG: phosphoribosylanthranilate isomerase [Conexibacteraceae bacterium]|nr:phosphoribosylanthranilate isomerase [Conexibacteraceae bacterium]